MGSIKQLAGQTAVYGLSSVIGRMLNYLLVPFYTRIFTTEQYGVVTEMYAYVAFLIIILTYGMETAFFKFSSESEDKKRVYSTTLISVFLTSTVFIFLTSVFSVPIAITLGYPNHTEYVIWFAIIVGLDALSAIPMAKLRELGKAKWFATVNLINIFVNIGLNLFFLVYCRNHYLEYGSNTSWLVDTCYDPEIGVGYVFISNLIATITRTLFLLPYILKIEFAYSNSLVRRMLIYSLPLLVAGLAGIVNETIDRIMIKNILFDRLGEVEAMSQLGIYGACYKISIIITIFIQAFRYASEPFFFAKQKDGDAKEIYRDIMKYFIIAVSCIFLAIMLYIDYVMLFVGEEFRIGAAVVPILLMANLCLGVYFNLSIWYKLTSKTMYGAGIAIFGAIITVTVNYMWIPIIGYMASAWATLICYFAMMVISYIIGQKHYPVNYNLIKGIGYPIAALGLFYLSTLINQSLNDYQFLINTLILLLFAGGIIMLEKPKQRNEVV
ncbi:MAG: polysaccharide biosynthesis protein [Flavobacteriales bacterium]|nr:polysaccharide biosynthesis protein [Flavobacteriales bacterium]